MDISLKNQDGNDTIKITIEKKESLHVLEGKSAELWEQNMRALAVMAAMNNLNPFDLTEIEWKVTKK